MIVRRSFAILTLVGAQFAFVPPAVATDAQDAYFESCMTECFAREMGDANFCSAMCYQKAYGSEHTGGGPPEVYSPGNGRQCYGSFDPGFCNPY